ncbi:hypothetical protein WAI453_007374 [Rhynchosporium graminicola]
MKRNVKYKAQAEDLVMHLIWAHSSLRNTCEKLLSRLQLSDEDVICLLQNLNGLAWSSPDLEQRIQRILKSDYKACQPRLCDYTTKERYQISLTLAYAVLQFYGTPWLQEIWSKKEIYFIGSNQYLVDSLYLIQHPIPKQNARELTGLPELRPWANPTTYALGIVLLELAFGFPLEAIHPDTSDLGPGGLPDALTELRKARRLALMIEERDGEGLATTIIKCMRYDAFEPEDSRFQECFYNDVIVPLEICLGYMQ